MATLKVAVTQFELRSEKSVEQFLAHVEQLVKQAAEQSADLILFPELASTGLLGSVSDRDVTLATVDDDYRKVLAPLAGEILAGLKRLAAQYDLIIAGGSHNRIADDGSLRNTAYLVWPDGRVESQDKIHLTPPELGMGARGGDDLLITEIGGFIVALLICADIEYPELSRYLTAKGVTAILCPSLTWNRRGAFRVRCSSHARAMENQLYVVMSPLIGHNGLPVDHPLYTTGHALVAAPVDKIFGHHDGVVVSGEGAGETVVFATLDSSLIDASRAKPEPPGLALRRPDLYRKHRAELNDY